jgi:hypothetical protein
MLPNYLIIGAIRSGTTYLSSNLRAHPEVFMARQKELHFFDRDYDKGLEFYESYFPEKNDGEFIAIGEATPAYLYFEEVPEKIHEHLPESKLIVSLRNPIDAAYSHYWKAYSVDEKTRAMTFEQKVERNARLVGGGRYFEQISRYMELFPREKFYALIYEEMIANPEEELRKLYRFLGVDEDFISPFLRTRSNSSAMKNSEHRILYAIHRILFRRFNVPLPGLARFIESKAATRIPPMAEDTRLQLYEKFSDDIEKLEEFLGRDLNLWKPQSV